MAGPVRATSRDMVLVQVARTSRAMTWKGRCDTSIVMTAGIRRRPGMTASRRRVWRDRIIPFRVEYVPLDIEYGHLRIADLDPLGIAPCTEFAAHRQAGLRCRGGDQLDHRRTAGQRPATLIAETARCPNSSNIRAVSRRVARMTVCRDTMSSADGSPARRLRDNVAIDARKSRSICQAGNSVWPKRRPGCGSREITSRAVYFNMVPRGGIEPPTLRFSVACSTN